MFVATFACFMLGCVIFGSLKTQAAPLAGALAGWTYMPQQLPEPGMTPAYPNSQYINLTIGGVEPGYSGYGANLPTSSFKIYSNSAANRTITFSLVNRATIDTIDCYGYDILLSTNGAPFDNIFWADGCSKDYTFVVPASAFVALTGEREGLFGASVTLKIQKNSASIHTVHTSSFKLKVDPGGRLGYAGGSSVTIYGSLNNDGYRLNARFRAACNSPANNVEHIRWFDDDNDSLAQNEPVLNDAPDSPVGTANPADDLFVIRDDGVSAKYSEARFTNISTWPWSPPPRETGEGGVDAITQPGRSYELSFKNIEGGNGIAIQYPTDSGDFYIPCIPPTPPTPDVDCTATVVSGQPAGWPANSVKAGQTFTVTVTLKNNTKDAAGVQYPAPESYGGGRLSASTGTRSGNWYVPVTSPPTATDGWYPNYRGVGIAAGDEVPLTVTYTAPPGIGSYELRMYSDYANAFAMHGCPVVTINTYQPFELVPQANTPNASPDPENPESISYSTQLWQTESGSVDGVPYTSNDIPTNGSSSLIYYQQGTYKLNDFHNQIINGSYGPPVPGASFGTTWNDTVAGRAFNHGGTVDTWQAGDRYCSKITINPATGWIGPGNSIINGQPDEDVECADVQNRPYIRAYGSDVFGGGNFGTSGGAGGILAYYKDGTQGAGSGVEFAAFAIDSITGFASASLRSASSPLPPYGLTFANTGAGSPGNFVGARTVPDYFSNALKSETIPQSPPGNVQTNAGAYADNSQTFFDSGGSKVYFNTGAGDGSGYNKRHAFFVEGDVVIRNNITYANTGNYGSIAQIPSFALFVRGNIYIANNVTNLDGLYVAQPKNGTGGTIYTCSDTGGNLYGQVDMYNSCGNKLRINGAFASQNLKLLRTYKTLSDIPFTAPGLYKDETFDDENSAESFRILPEFFLANPVFKADGSQTNGKYDYITTLPPIL